MLSGCLALTACKTAEQTAIDVNGPVAGWPVTTGTEQGAQYSPLTQINRDNVGQLEIAWSYESPDHASSQEEGGELKGSHASSGVETTPVLLDEKLLMCTPSHRVIALDARTGNELWNYDPKMDPSAAPSHFCRGVAVWRDPDREAGGSCRDRVFGTSGEGRLFAIDGQTGKPCPDFGTGGEVSLKEHMGEVKPRAMYQSSPPLVVGDLAVVGGAVFDNYRTRAPGGVVRAYDVRTGELRWAWDPVAPEMTPVTAEDAKNGATFTRGTPNVWTTMTADLDNGLIYLPTGNAGVDFYKGAKRPIDHYGSSVVALKIATGEVVWSFQTVRHDIWDYDIANQPVLYTDKSGTPALAAATKTGSIFLLNRLTGEPLFPIEERPVPKSTIAGEWTAPTQPFPTLPRPLARTLERDDIMNFPIVSTGCRERFDSVRYEGIFTPPSEQGTLQYPGLSGGFNWGSIAINTDTNVLVGVYLDLPWIVTLTPRDGGVVSGDGKEVPTSGFGQAPQYDTDYTLVTMPFLSDRGIPCNKPPWGSLIAIDLDTGKQLWRRPLGSLRGRMPLIGSLIEVGVPVSGGVMQTASGLAFAGASADETFRAFDTASGEVLWSTALPFSAHATPMTYRLSADGKQYVVVATGGLTGVDKRIGNTIVAFALPSSGE